MKTKRATLIGALILSALATYFLVSKVSAQMMSPGWGHDMMGWVVGYGLGLYDYLLGPHYCRSDFFDQVAGWSFPVARFH